MHPWAAPGVSHALAVFPFLGVVIVRQVWAPGARCSSLAVAVIFFRLVSASYLFNFPDHSPFMVALLGVAFGVCLHGGLLRGSKSNWLNREKI